MSSIKNKAGALRRQLHTECTQSEKVRVYIQAQQNPLLQTDYLDFLVRIQLDIDKRLLTLLSDSSARKHIPNNE